MDEHGQANSKEIKKHESTNLGLTLREKLRHKELKNG
jgi:hypothetical protein